MMMFENKVCVVTGGGSGIGQATAIEFAKRGAKVAILDRDQNGLDATSNMLADTDSEVLALTVNVNQPNEVEAAFGSIVKELGRVDFVIANAGVSGGPDDGFTADMPLDTWHNIIDVNLNGAFYTAKFGLGHMLESGDGGVIVFISSIMGQISNPGISPYVASKHAVVGLSKTIAAEYGAQNIRSLAVAPGFIETPMTDMVTQDETALGGVLAMTPMARMGKAKEVAKFIATLSSDDASFVSGGYYPVDGGYLAT